MKIGIDVRCLMEGKRTGVEEYTLNLLENLFEIDDRNEYVLFLNSYKVPDICLQKFLNNKNVHLRYFRYPNKLLNLFFWYFRWPKIDKMIGGVDIMFLPNINFAAISRKAKLYLTVHDLSFESYPETFSWKRRLWHFLINPRSICRKADKIFTVSDSTGADLSNLYGIDSEKIEVIPSAVSNEFRVIDRNSVDLIETKEKYGLPYKFILYLGTIEPRKNITSLVRAYEQLRKNPHPDLKKVKLVLAGTKGWKSKKIFKEIAASEFSKDIIITGFIEDQDKVFLYNLASLFVYPSFFEGFGFPVVEAMRSGVPVITSNSSSLPEIAGDAAVTIDPEKPDELFQAMQEVLLKKDLREKLSRRGLKRAENFSWKKAAQKYLEQLNAI